jgi:hypothetical protein
VAVEVAPELVECSLCLQTDAADRLKVCAECFRMAHDACFVSCEGCGGYLCPGHFTFADAVCDWCKSEGRARGGRW